METTFHNGERLRLLSIQKNKSETDIANIRGVTKQAINNDFNREKIGLKTIKKYCDAIGITLEDFYPKPKTELQIKSDLDLSTDNNNYMYKYFNLLETTNKLLTIVAQNGIKVDLGLGKFREVLKKPFEVPQNFLGVHSQSSARMPYPQTV